MYIMHPDFAREPQHYIRAFELLFMLCIYGLASGSKPIARRSRKKTAIKLVAIGNMRDYKKLENTHHLSSYEVVIPVWQGT